jgi:predicted phage tail protein
MLRRIKLYGSLAKFIGKRVLYADVASAAEAVRFLVANWPEVRQHMGDKHYKVFVGDWNVSTDELHAPAGQQEIKIVPVVGGAGKVGQIIAGAALFAVSFLATAGGGAVFGAAFAKNLGLLAAGQAIGGALVFGGVAQLLTPTPQLGATATGNAGGLGGTAASVGTGADSGKDPRKSYNFSGIQNVSRQGLSVPTAIPFCALSMFGAKARSKVLPHPSKTVAPMQGRLQASS